ncbi:MAG: hypothetical protein A2X36_07940 [Elusimicrobia bacterium GWA2_69_24]|nr:MAG: hypothetical protein A2X52_08815 [Candidatus Rokubacteria bacterium GWC2_70_16]OGR58603.1 MAG: hypothetical protein A2X36_07940 [Elusimicrobia bacterium GWA2_69_24]HBH03715.1 hypothetical protein [Candidatus Rokubacteria bacterium]
MAMPAHPHMKRDEQGVAWIDNANVKVIEVVEDRLACGWSPKDSPSTSRWLRSTRPSPTPTTTRRRWTPRSPADLADFAGRVECLSLGALEYLSRR